jgi:uncharacterized protein YndB with AHSA1/START domain
MTTRQGERSGASDRPPGAAAASVGTVVEMVSDRDIFTTCTLDKPRELVFRAWIEPEHLARWWGPQGFTNTFHQHEPRSGGAWNFVMHGPDGVDYKNKQIYVEVVAPERIVLQHVSGPFYTSVITFSDRDGKTFIDWRTTFENPAVLAKIKDIVIQGNKDNIERLEAELARMT